MHVSYFFDPSCPWCWITSRWLEQVNRERDLHITWRLFSLAYKNGELDTAETTEKTGSHLAGQRVLRVLQHLSDTSDADIGALYRQFGKRHFIDGDAYSDTVIAEVLNQHGINAPDLSTVADNAELDTAIIKSTNEATKLVGDDIGVPTIVFQLENNEMRGFFGPVLTRLPNTEDSLQLWDSLVALARIDGLSELKRGRDGGPDTASTDRVFSDEIKT